MLVQACAEVLGPTSRQRGVPGCHTGSWEGRLQPAAEQAEPVRGASLDSAAVCYGAADSSDVDGFPVQQLAENPAQAGAGASVNEACDRQQQ